MDERSKQGSLGNTALRRQAEMSQCLEKLERCQRIFKFAKQLVPEGSLFFQVNKKKTQIAFLSLFTTSFPTQFYRRTSFKRGQAAVAD